MVNPHRGELNWTVNGHTYTLRLTMSDIAALEAAHGQQSGIMEVVTRFRENTYGVRVIATILQRGLLSGMGTRLKTEEVYALIDECGFPEAAETAIRLLSKGLGADDAPRDSHSPPLPQTHE